MGESLKEYIARRPIINTHSHHFPGAWQKDTSLDAILKASYNSWCMASWDETDYGRREFCRKMQGNTYFFWFERSLQQLTGHTEPLNEHTWTMYDKSVRELSADPDYHLRVMKEKCLYRYALWDPYWEPNTCNELPGFYTPVYRIDMFLFGYSPDARDHDGNNPQKACGWTDWPDTYEEYLALIEAEIASAKARGCVALKNATAYDRTLCYRPVSRTEAGRIWGKKNPTAEEIRDFQDGTFHFICGMAEKYRMPIQCHTGLGALDGSNAMQLRGVIKQYPKVRFILFHASYPWMEDVLALLHTFPNVTVDLCWLPLLSTSACKRFLREYIEGCTMDRITWGCDTWNSVESYGAVLAIRHVLETVLGDCVNDGLLSFQTAKAYADHILFSNAQKIYQIS